MNVLVLCVLLTGVCFVEAADGQDGTDNNELGRGLDPGRFLSTMATNFMSRGYAPSGLGVLMKVLIFAATAFGGKHFKDEYGRSEDGQPEKFLTEEEILMFLSYLSGSPGCLQHIACQQPQKAKKYVAAGDLLLKAAKVFSLNTDVNYHYALQGMDQAANIGLAGGKCSAYQCGTKDN